MQPAVILYLYTGIYLKNTDTKVEQFLQYTLKHYLEVKMGISLGQDGIYRPAPQISNLNNNFHCLLIVTVSSS